MDDRPFFRTRLVCRYKPSKAQLQFFGRDVKKLDRYDALEIFSPFGDHTELWDRILNEEKSPHCMASNDLRYLPKEEYKKQKCVHILRCGIRFHFCIVRKVNP
ncbi:hypothetical protein [Leptospira adleri]|uniref:hypothetical protein n=1 Tax=Leptospira adleri TaxID=2023186 RepID=UPI0010835FF8|nr:hypothetical protein [Leptospira adleri]TGM52786.1 hypothetical protein EHQ97_12745 [Leptospira adleri]